MMNNVFVYGTLKNGFHNNVYLEGYDFEDAHAMGFEMYGKNSSYPFVKQGSGIVAGEVYYNIYPETLRELDMLEGHPEFYHRELATIEVGDKVVEAWIYLNERYCESAERVLEGMWI
jgi:gamma-glutamylaminecyclotransferase